MSNTEVPLKSGNSRFSVKDIAPFFTIISGAVALINLFSSSKDNTLLIILCVVFFVSAGISLYSFIKSKRILNRTQKEYQTLIEKDDTVSQNLEKARHDLIASKQRITDLERSEKILLSNNQILESNISKGIKYSVNNVTVEFDVKKRKYKMQFEKHYQIIGNHRWYEGQIYFNNSLGDYEKSKNFYETNLLSWEDLNFRASISYQNEGNTDGFSEEEEVEVMCAARGANYIQFHIKYQRENNGILDIKHNSTIHLKYSYEIPITHWGSYINRYVSYFGEPLIIVLRYPKDQNIFPVDVHRIGSDDQVVNCKQTDYTTRSSTIDGITAYSIKIPGQKLTKYRVSWKTNQIFGIETTKMVPDTTGLTLQ